MAYDKHGATLAVGDVVTVTGRVQAVPEDLSSNEITVQMQTSDQPALSDPVLSVYGLAVEKVMG